MFHKPALYSHPVGSQIRNVCFDKDRVFETRWKSSWRGALMSFRAGGLTAYCAGAGVRSLVLHAGFYFLNNVLAVAERVLTAPAVCVCV